MSVDGLAAISQVVGRAVSAEELSTLYTVPAVAALLQEWFADPMTWETGQSTRAAVSTTVVLLPTLLWDFLSASVRRETKVSGPVMHGYRKGAACLGRRRGSPADAICALAM